MEKNEFSNTLGILIGIFPIINPNRLSCSNKMKQIFRHSRVGPRFMSDVERRDNIIQTKKLFDLVK